MDLGRVLDGSLPSLGGIDGPNPTLLGHSPWSQKERSHKRGGQPGIALGAGRGGASVGESSGSGARRDDSLLEQAARSSTADLFDARAPLKQAMQERDGEHADAGPSSASSPYAGRSN